MLGRTATDDRPGTTATAAPAHGPGARAQAAAARRRGGPLRQRRLRPDPHRRHLRDGGRGQGLFYWYFENKESLFAELVRSVRQQLRREAAAMDDDADPVTRLRQGTEASVRFMAEHGRFFALLEVERHDQRVAAVLRESGDVYVRTRRAWSRGAAAAWSPTTDPRCSPSASSAPSPSSSPTTTAGAAEALDRRVGDLRRAVDDPGARRGPQSRPAR